MQRWAPPESSPSSGKPTPFSDEYFSDDTSASDTENFVKTLTRIQSKGVRPDLIGSIITHYASKCLPDLAADEPPKTQTAAAEPERWRKRRFIETLVGILPAERDAVPCDFLLRVLRVASAAGVEARPWREEIERRVSLQLEQASVKELMGVDMEAVVRVVRGFVRAEEVSRSGGALMKVAKIVDGYLGEAAVDPHLSLAQFLGVATALPSHARSSDDGMYRAIDIYLKAHPSSSKQERKRLCMLIDSRKLSTEASLHAAQNERLPVRAVIQVLLSEQDKLNKHIDWSGSLQLSPGFGVGVGVGPDATSRCLSKREAVRQHMEIRRLKEDVLLLQSQCMSMENQIEKLLEKKKGYFSWKNFGRLGVFKGNQIGGVEGEGGEVGVRMNTPMQVKARSSNKWKKSMQIQGI